MPRPSFRCAAALAAALSYAGPALAQDFGRLSCGDLWMARNSIYHEARYCFRTQRAISMFGNAGCQFDRATELPLNPDQQRKIADITRAERASGCTD